MKKPHYMQNGPNDNYLKIDGSVQFSEKDERVVWQRFIEGDDESLIYMYRKYVDLLYRYGQQFTKRHEFVSDCIQELFIDLIDKRKKLSAASSIKGYLFASLKRRIIRNIKKEERLQLEEDGFSFSFAEAPLSISSNLKERDFKIIHEKINLLSPSQREAIFLYFYEGLSYAEIAEILDVKVSSARILTYRALDNLQKHIGPLLSSFYSLLLYLSQF